MDPFNALSTAAATRMIPLLREVATAKVTSRALVASTDLEKALDAMKDVIGGVGVPLAMMSDQLAKPPGRLATVGGQLTPLEVGQPSPVCHSSLAAQGRGLHPFCVLSPRPTIGKEHHLVMPTRPSTGVLTPKNITIRCLLVVLSSSSDDDLPLVRHHARVDLNSGGTRIYYTQEPTLMSDSPPQISPPYIVLGQ
jgi:hypothetical protein